MYILVGLAMIAGAIALLQVIRLRARRSVPSSRADLAEEAAALFITSLLVAGVAAAIAGMVQIAS